MAVPVVSIYREFERKNGQTQSGTKKQKTQKDTLEAYRSGMKLAILGLSSVLLLTGCASSPSLEDQTKLLEYEKCIDFLELQNQDSSPNALGYKDLIELYEAIRAESCAKYRP